MTTSIRIPVGAVAALLTSGALVAQPAFAQPRDAAASEALFQEGRRLMKSGDFAAACPKLEESLRLDPALGTLVNLASCEEELGRSASAWQHWRAAADQLPGGDKRRTTAVTRAAALEKVLARLTISLADGAPADAEVVRDGVRLGSASLGLPLPVDPGAHKVVVSAPSREAREYQVTVRAKEHRSLVVEPGATKEVARAPIAPEPERSATTPPSPPRSDLDLSVTSRTPPAASKRSPVLGYVFLGGAVAAFGAAGYAGLQALAARKDAKTGCPKTAGRRVCSADASHALDEDRRFSLYTDIGLGAGAVLAGAGLYFLLRSPGEENTTSAFVAPRPGGAEVQLSGRF